MMNYQIVKYLKIYFKYLIKHKENIQTQLKILKTLLNPKKKSK